MSPAIAQIELLAQGNLVNLLLWSSGIIVVLMLAGAVMLWVRRKYYENRSGGEQTRFSLAGLERMYQDGRISRDEFRRLRNAVLGLIVKAEAPPAGPESPAEVGGQTETDEKNPGGELSPPPPDDDGKQ